MEITEIDIAAGKLFELYEPNKDEVGGWHKHLENAEIIVRALGNFRGLRLIKSLADDKKARLEKEAVQLG